MKLSEVKRSVKDVVIDDIIKILDDINHTYRKDGGADFDVFKDIKVLHGPLDVSAIVITLNSNAVGDRSDYVSLLKDVLKDDGIIGGVMPINVSVAAAAFENDSIIIRVSKAKE